MPSRTDSPAPFLSHSWIEDARERIQGEGRLLKRLLGERSVTLLLLVDDRPGLAGEAIFIEFVQGRLDRVEWGPRRSLEPARGSADFRVHGGYQAFAEVHEGKLSELSAVLSGRLKVKGDWSKAVAFLVAVVELNKVLRQVPARYNGDSASKAGARGQ